MIRIGNIFEIPLKGERKSFGQFVFKDMKIGPLIQVFDLIINKEISLNIDDLYDVKPLFPPVITGLQGAIRAGLWRVIGKLEVKNFVYPNFISAYYDQKTGEAYQWFVWDGEKDSRVGSRLPDELKKLEYLVVWHPYDIPERIETGVYPYPYGDLIKYNKFVPGEKSSK